MNRTPPKTQAALLEAMEERQVTIDGAREPLPAVLRRRDAEPRGVRGHLPAPRGAARPLPAEGPASTTPPPRRSARSSRRAAAGFDGHDLDAAGVSPVLSRDDLAALRGHARALPVAPPVLDYVARLVRASRELPRVRLGASPRAGVALLAASRARAALRGAEWLSPDDVKAMAPAALRHRLVLRPEAELEGATPDDLVRELLDGVEVPR